MASSSSASSSRFLQLQTEAAYTPSTPVSRRTSAQSTASVSSAGSSATFIARTDNSQELTPAASSFNSSTSHTGSYDPSSFLVSRPSMFSEHRPYVEVMRCSRCAKSCETITSGSPGRRVSTDDAHACGMVRFGTNLYYCHPCARKVGYT